VFDDQHSGLVENYRNALLRGWIARGGAISTSEGYSCSDDQPKFQCIDHERPVLLRASAAGTWLARLRFLNDNKKTGSMVDDRTNRGLADRKRIGVWAEKFAVSADEVKRPVLKVRPMAEDVTRELGRTI
jgi:hypothetical protein